MSTGQSIQNYLNNNIKRVAEFPQPVFCIIVALATNTKNSIGR